MWPFNIVTYSEIATYSDLIPEERDSYSPRRECPGSSPILCNNWQAYQL